MKKAFGAIAPFILCTVTMFGQAPQSTAPQGVPYENHGLYSIDLQDGSLVFNLPIRSKPGFRASFTGAADRVAIWATNPIQLMPVELNTYGTAAGSAYPTNNISVNGMVGPAAMIASGAHTAPEECSVGVYKINTSNWYVEDASGTVHPLPPNDTYIGCTGHGFTDQTLDYAFKVTVTSTNIQVWANDGSTSGPGTSGAILSWTDKNGNVTSVNSTFTSWKDPMNGIVPLTSSTGIGSSPSYSWTDINGGTQTFAMASTANYIKTSYGCPSPYEDQTGTNAIDLVTSVSFPDGSSLGIAYEPNGSGFTTGRISELTLPTGGTVAFAYSGFNCTYAVPTEMTMTTTDGTWTYTWAPVSYGSGTSETYGNTLTVKDPAGNSIVHTYIGLTATNAGSNTFGVFEVERQSFPEGSSTAGMTTTTCYNGNTTNCLSTNSGPLITSLVSTTTWAGMSTSQEHAMTLDLYGDVLTDTLYNFSGTQYNETINTFNATAGCSSNANAPSLRCTTESLYSGSEVSAKTFTYDASGDALTINSWLTGNTGITTTNTYYTNGTLHTSLDPGGVTTTYTYGDCDGFMPTKIALSSTLYTSFTYGTAGCDGGVPVTSTDANGNVTHLDYSAGAGADPYYRQLIAVDPQGNYHYHEYSPTNTVAYMQFASSMDFVAQEVDGYGRVINVQKENGPSSTSYDTGSVAYGRSTTGGLGSFVSGYTPCVAGYYSTCEGTLRGTFQNDYLGRPSTQTTGLGGVTAYTYSGSDVKAVTTPAPSGENTKAAITESNGLWSTITCPIVTSTLPAGVSCGTAYLTGTGYPETSTFSVSGGVRTYTTTRGLQSHTRTVDSLGRTITESYPESNTVHYYYDAQSPHGCPTSNGRLTERDDTKGNEVCYTYDAYGRLTKTATNGTQCRQLFYDNSNGFTGTIPSGVTVGNPYGHLVEAATTNCSSTLLTDEWMSYDSLGRVNNAWESTPHSGGYYHATETYFPNNLVNVEALGTALSTTYSVDGEGHWFGAQIGSANTVTGVTYNAEQKPLVISFPTGEVGTTTSAAIAQHATTFTVASATNIAINQNLTIDSLPNVEQVQVASVSGTSVTIGSRGSGFRHPHSSGVAVVSQTGDTDTYAYNPSNGGMNSFTLDSDESGGYLGGTIGYNANGTIATVALTDTFNTGGNQTCDYLYDDLSRLASDLCGTGSLSYRSTMTYDSYDNITKSSSNGTGPTWPISGTYSATNNQLSSSTYDGNGSVLTDYFHTYSWDGFNKMLMIDSNTMTYDAFGRVVELAVSGTYTQHWYTPVGTKVLMNGSTIVKAHLPMPGGLTADWTPSGTYVNHKDWVGSSRLSTQAGAVYTDQALGPYGESTAQEYGASGEFNYASMTQDIETGVYDTPARQYMPSQGRWPSVDPAHASWNGYAYVTNPLSFSDPSGLDGGQSNPDYDDGEEGGPPSTDPTPVDAKADVNDGNTDESVVVNPDGSITVTAPMPPSVETSGPQTVNNDFLFADTDNGRDCTVASAGKLQYVGATLEADVMTTEFFSGLGSRNLTFAPNSATSQVMAQSAGVQDVLNNYYMTGQTTGLYTFGLPGLVAAGGNPVAQFVGSFRWSISPTNVGIDLSLTNTTSFRSLTYDAGPQWQRGSWPTPMGNTHQTFNITATCH